MKITKYRKCDKEGSLLGYFSLTYIDSYGERFINDMKLFRNKAGHQFITHPDKSYQAEDGTTKFAAYTGYTNREYGDKFQIDVLSCLNAFFNETATNIPVHNSYGHQSNVNHQNQASQIQYPHVNNVNRMNLHPQTSLNQNEELPF